MSKLVMRRKRCPRDEEDSARQTRTRFQEVVAGWARSKWPQDGSVEEKWSSIRSSLTESAEAVLGAERRYHPDCFIKSAATLEPMLQRRNHLYVKWLATGRSAAYRDFGRSVVMPAELFMKQRTVGSKLWQRSLRGGELVGRKYGDASEPCSLVGED